MKLRDLTGKTVQLKPRFAKWLLEHQEMWEVDGVFYDTRGLYEPETLINLICCLGEPVYGRVLGFGSMCYSVEFKIAGIKIQHYIDRRDFKVL